MLVNKLASACYNAIKGGLQGFTATENISIEQLEDEIVEERLAVLKIYSKLNLIPLKDLMVSLNCIELDCLSLDKCCLDSEGGHGNDFSKPIAHFEIPQIVNDFGETAIAFLGSTDKSVKFKVYTSPVTFKYQKYKLHRASKPYVYIDTTPNQNNAYDGWVFNAPLLERISIMAIFKDPRLVEKYACCGYTEADNFSFLATEVKKNIIQKYMSYYRQMYPAVTNPDVQLNDQTPK